VEKTLAVASHAISNKLEVEEESLANIQRSRRELERQLFELQQAELAEAEREEAAVEIHTKPRTAEKNNGGLNRILCNLLKLC
jgi:hypothetical protein